MGKFYNYYFAFTANCGQIRYLLDYANGSVVKYEFIPRSWYGACGVRFSGLAKYYQIIFYVQVIFFILYFHAEYNTQWKCFTESMPVIVLHCFVGHCEENNFQWT